MAAPHEAFARRLHRALDLSGVEKGRGRTARLAAIHDVSRETARKWLSGLSLPELERLIDMAIRFEVSFEWLATGRGQPQVSLSVAEAPAAYDATGRDDARLLGLVRRLPREKRQALLTLLDDIGTR